MDPNHEAERLNEILDALVTRAHAGDEASPEWADVIRALESADRSTPEPDPHFLSSLRASLERARGPATARSRRAETLGIVARPAHPPVPLHRRRWLSAGALLGAMILALIASGVELPGSNSHSLGVATVSASSTAVAPTPTPTGFVTSVPTTRHGSST